MYYSWKPYVSVGQRLAKALKFASQLAKKEKRERSPVKVMGRKLATKFWGQAWCDNLDHYSDIANRLPRGRRYLGNGSVVDLQIKRGLVQAIVAGSEVYKVSIKIKALPAQAWKNMQSDCAQSIHSLIDLLQGRFDEGVMRRLAQREGGLFPQPKEIEMACSCPDYARVCKHIAAVMYGVGVRLDTSPELLFTLRNVDHTELITQAIAAENLEQNLSGDATTLGGSDLGELFGIDLATSAETPARPVKTRRKAVTKKATPVITKVPAPVGASPRTRRPAAAAKRRGGSSLPVKGKRAAK